MSEKIFQRKKERKWVRNRQRKIDKKEKQKER